MAKRLRYAAEAAAIDDKHAGRLEKAAHGIQKVPGRHQDSVVARDVLRRLAAEGFLEGENAFTYGRLHAWNNAWRSKARQNSTTTGQPSLPNSPNRPIGGRVTAASDPGR